MISKSKIYKKNLFSLIILTFILCKPTPAKTQEQSLWEDLRLDGGQINSIAIDPADASVLYAGSWGGDGLFKSIDYGTTWTPILSDNSSWFKNITVFDISIDPNNPGTIWVANADYIDVSYNDGITWKSLDFASQEGRFCFTVAVDPHDISGNTVYVGTGGPYYSDELGTVFKTNNGGITWLKTSLQADFNVFDLKINPHKPDEIWVACNPYQISPYGQICMTIDGGLSWTKWNFNSYIDELVIHPVNPLLIFGAGGKGVIQKNADWKQLEPSTHCSSLCIPHADPSILYAGLIDTMAKTTDLGLTWSYYESPGEFLSLVADPFDKMIIYAGHVNRGVFKSTDGALTWNTISHGISANVIFASDISPFDNSTILSGTFSGIYKNTDMNSWKLLSTEPSEAVRFHPIDEKTLFAGFDWGIGKSTDDGTTWNHVSIGDQEDAYGVSSISISPMKPETVFAGVFFFSGNKGYVIKSSDKGEHYEVVFETSVPVNCVRVHPTNPEIIYAGTGSFNPPVIPGRLYKSTDGGKTWTSTALRNVVINSIAIAKSKPELIFAGCGGYDYSGSGIYRSTDSGRTWEPKNCGLPDRTSFLGSYQQPSFSATEIRLDKKNSDIAYAALYDHGIYISLDAGNYWAGIGLSDYFAYTVNTRFFRSKKLPSEKLRNGLLLPSSTVLAGTASGLYQYQTTGTGILTGVISSAQTNDLIDSATLSASCGGTCSSSNGYYLLMLPAGIHSVTAQAAGYVPATFSGITIHSGESSPLDISLQPTGDDATCPATLILKNRKHRHQLSILKKFKDNVLKKTPKGNELINLYYRNGNRLWNLLQNHQQIKERCFVLLTKLIPVISLSLTGESIRLSRSLTTEMIHLLDDLHRISGNDLKPEILRLKNQIEDQSFAELLGVY